MSSDAEPQDSAEEMGPVDFLIVEFPGKRAPGTGLPLFLDLVDRGIVRILDIDIFRKDLDGTVVRANLAELSPELAAFDGASSGLVDQYDIDNTAKLIAPDSAACILVYENRWAAPFAVALRREGGQLVTSGRLPVQALLAQLDATEPVNAGV